MSDESEYVEIPAYEMDGYRRALGCGLSGSHRTGKTTLAARIAEKNEIPFVQTSMSALANQMGIKIGLDMPFDQRRALQDAALEMFEHEYAKHAEGRVFVTDRTPIDLAAYAMTAWHPAVIQSEDDSVWLKDYMERCYDAANRWFFHINIIQPGSIPFVVVEQKGENIPAYLEALNVTMIGLAWCTEYTGNVSIMPRTMIDLSERSGFVAKHFSNFLTAYAKLLHDDLTIQ